MTHERLRTGPSRELGLAFERVADAYDAGPTRLSRRALPRAGGGVRRAARRRHGGRRGG
ncbi:hypothetical protein ACFSTC_61315 [Nonomuraea ferruginea]